MKERNLEATSIKIPTGLLKMIDDDVAINQDFRNRSEWIIAAIRFYESERIRIIAERKAAFSDPEGSDYSPSGSLRLRDDEVRGRFYFSKQLDVYANLILEVIG